MKLIKIAIPMILVVFLNCAGQGAVETENSASKAPISGGTTVTANSAKVFDSSGTLIGHATNITPWVITVVFSNGYFSVIDFGGNQTGNTTVFYYSTANCTGTAYVKYTQSFFAKSISLCLEMMSFDSLYLKVTTAIVLPRLFFYFPTITSF